MLNKLECIILGHLVRTPMAGYDLHKWLNQEGPFFGYTPQPSQIYRQLTKCLDKGWVNLVIDHRNTGPDAKVYRLTDAGVATFKEWALSPHVPTVRPLDSDFQMRFLLTGILGPEVALKILSTELDYRRDQQRVKAYSDDLDPEDAAIEVDATWHKELVRLGRERSYLLGTTYLTWLELTHARLTEQIADYAATGGGPVTGHV
ncbi:MULTISPECIES: PadR family transcriptional regulator [Arthrobacter]|uniref:PadR family transcriptional regulator n=1 Tax=Arthrobacter psychrochitiniphilus TaxID=291045 RepID=A0A2V3DW27_9MICC|nr:PadR family transcriptional regulator [Arthrobacter psychrochitiniphilus]NYG16349.1 DNA-binding PadR family transcriptional regulator [Arthrobacter psychrochitiniphilus]PXA69489.1 PadR family transcriptional regulator [Arthrobacter psychrochitiniphilus]